MDYQIPLGHEFPEGKTWSYTYTTGFENNDLILNLLTFTDGRRNDPTDATYGTGPYLQNINAHTIDPSDPRHSTDETDLNYNRIVAQIYGLARYRFLNAPATLPDPNSDREEYC